MMSRQIQIELPFQMQSLGMLSISRGEERLAVGAKEQEGEVVVIVTEGAAHGDANLEEDLRYFIAAVVKGTS